MTVKFFLKPVPGIGVEILYAMFIMLAAFFICLLLIP